MSLIPYVATLVAPKSLTLTNAHSQSFAQRIIDHRGRVSKSSWLASGKAADVYFTGAEGVRSTDLPYDVIIQPVASRCKKILIADMESTIIQQEMLDELALEVGISEQVAAITYRAMNGEIDFNAALVERVRLLTGQPESLLSKVAARMTLTPGARELVQTMKQAGAKCWLVSGGFNVFLKIIAQQAGFDRFFGNQLQVEQGRLTGKVVLPILGKEQKKNLMAQACKEYGRSLADCLAIGDGANDVPMLEACEGGGGLGIAFRAKPKVRDIIANQVNHSDLTALIYAQNYYGGSP